jgi:MFS family permease
MDAPKSVQTIRPKVDIWGMLVMILATATLILGFSRLGIQDKLGIGVILLIVSAGAWIGFIQIEKRVAAPILDPQVLFNRPFITARVASFLSIFGFLGILAYSPIFVQEVMEISPTISGTMLTPFTVIVAFMGIPAGILVSRTGNYKWLYNLGYAIVTLCMFAMWQFSADTAIWVFVLVTLLAGFGLGAIPTINTIVAQFAVPKRLIGVAVGGMFFFQMVGLSVAPPTFSIDQNTAPDLESGLQLVFLVGAEAMVLSLLLIITIPEVSMDTE